MWIKRDFLNNFNKLTKKEPIQVKILKGPRQVGKTSLLDSMGTHKLVLFDDHSIRLRAEENPSLFLDQFNGPLILDEITLVPNLFLEIKKRVDSAKREILKGQSTPDIDYWLTGSNQTLLSNYIQESLAGRAEYFNLNTLSIHELKKLNCKDALMKGGWPELYSNSEKDSVRYINNLISTFIEKDIMAAAGIENKSAFTKTLHLLAGLCGKMINFSDIATEVSVQLTTVQSWVLILEQNGLLKTVSPYFNNLNKRLIKTPKLYFEDTGLAVRLQGWSEYEPLYLSPYFGHLIENVVYSEISKFYTNNLLEPKIFFVRNKEKVEIDFLLEMPNKKFIAIEVKTNPQDFSKAQLKLLESLDLNIVAHWVVSLNPSPHFGERKVVSVEELYSALEKFI